MFDFLKKPCVRHRDAFAATLRKAGYKFKIDKKNCGVDIDIPSPHCKDLTINFLFNKDGKTITVFALSLRKFKEENVAKAYLTCNKLNNDSIWLRYCLDEERNELDGELTMLATGKKVGEDCLYVMREIAMEADDACAEFNL